MFHVSEQTIHDRYLGILDILAENFASSVSKDWFKIRKERAAIYAELLGRSLDLDLKEKLNGF